jgi:YHS domain-containing protein
MKQIAIAVLTAAMALNAWAENKSILNLNKTGVAIQGHDPVAFFTDNKPVKGKPEFVARHGGATYLFATKEHRDSFKADPAKYEPAFGGYCAFGVSKNRLIEIDVDAFQIVDGKLLLQYSKGIREDFNKDAKGNLTKANANWPGLVEKKGK